MYGVSKSTGIIGHWPLDGWHVVGTVARDVSRNSNNGVITVGAGGLTTGIHGEANGAYDFDGSATVITIADTPILRPGTGNFTMSFWVKVPFTGSGNWSGLVSKGMTSSATAHTWGFLRNGSSTNIINYQQATDIGGAYGANLTTGVLTDGWHLILATRIGTTVSLYVDGAYYSQDATAGDDLSSDYALKVGVDVIVNFSDVAIFDVCFYSYAMSAGQIAKLYQSYGV